MKEIVVIVFTLCTAYGDPLAPKDMFNFALTINGLVKHANTTARGCQILPKVGSGCPPVGEPCTTEATHHVEQQYDANGVANGAYIFSGKMPDESPVNIFVQTNDNKFVYAKYLKCSDRTSPSSGDKKDGKWYAMTAKYDNSTSPNTTSVVVHSDVKQIVYTYTSIESPFCPRFSRNLSRPCLPDVECHNNWLHLEHTTQGVFGEEGFVYSLKCFGRVELGTTDRLFLEVVGDRFQEPWYQEVFTLTCNTTTNKWYGHVNGETYEAKMNGTFYCIYRAYLHPALLSVLTGNKHIRQ